jgi:hypothetical protein
MPAVQGGGLRGMGEQAIATAAEIVRNYPPECVTAPFASYDESTVPPPGIAGWTPDRLHRRALVGPGAGQEEAAMTISFTGGRGPC